MCEWSLAISSQLHNREKSGPWTPWTTEPQSDLPRSSSGGSQLRWLVFISWHIFGPPEMKGFSISSTSRTGPWVLANSFEAGEEDQAEIILASYTLERAQIMFILLFVLHGSVQNLCLGTFTWTSQTMSDPSIEQGTYLLMDIKWLNVSRCIHILTSYYTFTHTETHTHIYIYIYYIWWYIYIYTYIYIHSMYVMHACMHAWMDGCMYVCM